MKQVTATELRNKVGPTLEAASREPVAILKNGRAFAVIVPQAQYERLSQLENDYWLGRVAEAEAEGYLTTSETAAFLKEKREANAKANAKTKADSRRR